MNSPIVTVVIPTHTGGRYVREAIDSVRAQTYQYWEIKVVCDGCEDSLDDYANDDRIEIIHQRRLGLSFARNRGYAAAGGEFVTFLDHDDVMAPGKLAIQVDVLQSNPDIGLCHTQFEQVDSELNFLVQGHGADIQYEDLLACRYKMLISTALVRRDAIARVGGFDPKTEAEDIDFVLKIARLYSLAFVPEVLLKYRRHDHNISGIAWHQYEEVEYVLRGYRRYLKRVGDGDYVGLIDRGRSNNKRVNASVAVQRARQASGVGLRGAGATASQLVIATCLSPSVVWRELREFIKSRAQSR